MRRYYLANIDPNSDRIEIEGELFHHIFTVCRRSLGDRFELINNNGVVFLVEVEKLLKKSAIAQVLEKFSALANIGEVQLPRLHLCLAISRFPVMDSIVERVVELGVSSLWPVYTRNCFMKAHLPSSRLERWKKIVNSATQQSGRALVMEIYPPVPLNSQFNESVNRISSSPGLFAYEGQGGLPVKDFFRGSDFPSQRPQDLWLVVGSEGGFSSEEAKLLENLQWQPLTLGKQVLRVETACLSLVAILKYEFNLMGL